MAGITLNELNEKLVRKKYRSRHVRCPKCTLYTDEIIHQSADDSCLFKCQSSFCGIIFLIVAPEFLPFGEFIDYGTFLFHCAECGKDDIWGIIPKGMKSECQCCN